MSRPTGWLLALWILVAFTTTSWASPRDTKVGDVRAVFAKEGASLRERGSALGKAIATLPYGTRVKVLETKLPWMRVQSIARPGTAAQTGWMKAYETVELNALSKSAAPAHTTYSGSGKVDARDVSTAGRQLDVATEKRFRAKRKDLEGAYRLVDAMEKATQDMDSAESVRFIYAGNLGRKGRDYARPGRVGPRPVSKGRGGLLGRRGGGLLGKIAGEGAKALGGGKNEARWAEALVEGASNYAADTKKSFSPQQEYFLGRAVAAEAIAKYGVDKDERLRAYVRQVGDTVVRLSNRVPANFGGYHFEVLDSDEINGISGPGGFVLLTRGAVKAAKTEDELAAIIGHELAHATLKHGERLLRQGKKFPSMIGNLAGAAAKGAGAGQFADDMAKFFTEAVGEMSRNAIDNRYGKNMEFEADREGTYLLVDVWYDHHALRSYLLHMRKGAAAFRDAATHASPVARAQALDPLMQKYGPFGGDAETVASRKARFNTRTGQQTFGIQMK